MRQHVAADRNPHNPWVASEPQSAVMVRIGDQDYPMISHPSCRTCRSPHRLFIEREILKGRGYSAISRQVASMQDSGEGELDPPSNQSIAAHVKAGHLPQPAVARRKIVERRAEQLGLQILGEDDLADYVVVNETIIHRGFERLVQGEIEPTMSDLLAALRNQHAFESTSEVGYDAEAYQQAMMVYFEAAQRHMDPDRFRAMMGDLNRNPILRALRERSERGDEGSDDLGDPEEPMVVQGEVEQVLASD